jgi:hypothetical protein
MVGAQGVEHGIADHCVVLDQQHSHGAFPCRAKQGLSGRLLKLV